LGKNHFWAKNGNIAIDSTLHFSFKKNITSKKSIYICFPLLLKSIHRWIAGTLGCIDTTITTVHKWILIV